MAAARGRVRAIAVALAVCACLPPAATAQERLVVPSPVLTIDQDGLFQRSAFGRRVLAEVEAASTRLAAENREIEADLTAEERDLTERRPGMEPDAFRALADAFDDKVVAIRRAQDQKTRELARLPEEARAQFFRAALPILTDIVRDRGAVAILDERAVLLSADVIDITEEALARIDALIGDGLGLAPADPGAPPGAGAEPPAETPAVPPAEGDGAVPGPQATP